MAHTCIHPQLDMLHLIIMLYAFGNAILLFQIMLYLNIFMSCYGHICRYACHHYTCLSTKSSVEKAIPTIQIIHHFNILLTYTNCICEVSFADLEKFQ